MPAGDGTGGSGPDSAGPGEPDRGRLEALDARIRAARDARRPKPGPAQDVSAAALAWRMVTELVLGVLLGAGIGWGIDGVTGATPLFLLVFGLLGFAAGVRTMMRSAREVTRRAERRAAEARAAEARGNGEDGARKARSDGARAGG